MTAPETKSKPDPDAYIVTDCYVEAVPGGRGRLYITEKSITLFLLLAACFAPSLKSSYATIPIVKRLLLVLLILLTGCALRPQVPAPGSADIPPFRPATLPPPPTPTSPPPVNTRPTPDLVCTDRLTFISDLTIPDKTVVAGNATLDKRWEVENSGTCNWDERYQLRLVGGPDLGANPVQSLYPARSGTRAVIRMMMTAPAKAGSYQSAWRAYNPKNEPFGETFYIDIIVK